MDRRPAIAAACGVGSLVVRAVGSHAVVPVGWEVTDLSPFTTGAGFCTFAALIALGVAVLRARVLPSGFAWVPLVLGIADIALRLTTAATTYSGRLHPLPLALLGLGWIALGVVLWSATPHRAASGSSRTT